MSTSLNTFVDLIGNFPKPTSLAEASGKELAAILAGGLESRGIEVLGIDPFDFCHCVRCRWEGREFKINVGIDDSTLLEMNRWNVQPYYSVSFLDRVRRRTYRRAFERLLLAIHDTLRETPEVRDIRWFPDFDAPWHLELQIPSDSPIRNPSADYERSTIVRLHRLARRISGWGTSPLVMLALAVCAVAMGGLGVIVVGIWLLAMAISGAAIPMFIEHYASSRCERRNNRK